VTGTDGLLGAWSRGSHGARHLVLSALEFPRAAQEFAATMAAMSLLAAAPRGDGHPVLVVRGLSGGNGATSTVRSYLRRLGHSVHSPRAVANGGVHAWAMQRLTGQVEELAGQHGQRVSLVGWSMGGVVVRELARRDPQQIRQVISLGAPLRSGPRVMNRARTTAPKDAPGPAAMPVPSTVIYSRSDGMLDWRRCLQGDGPASENIAVHGSHLGMIHNPAVMHVLADSLAQREGRWSPYQPPLFLRPYFPDH